jgi:putative flavoprotein involved in K+ transport
VVVGGGHNGLAMSRCLSDRGVDHVVLERAEVANSWRTQRWDSFTMLTPNWQARLPGQVYDAGDPDGFMTGTEVVEFIEMYADRIDAPVEAGTTVTSVRPVEGGYEVVTDQGTWRCRCVVLAGGACNLPSTPDCAAAVPRGVDQVNPLEYRRPDQLADGGVLVIGAAATGLQLADEIHASGRPVTLSVGEHVRMPRTYRGADIQHWMEAIGRLDERHDEVDDIVKARKVASPQLVGTPERRTLDLNAVTDSGVQLRGRLGAIRDGVAMFSGGLRNHCTLADQKLGRLLDDIDAWITDHGLDADVGPAERFEPTRVTRGAPLTLDLNSGEITTIIWATGFRPDLSWVELPVFDAVGHLRHDGGLVVDAPGVYLLGTSFLRRRRSSFLHGAVDDTRDLADHLVDRLAG